MTIHWGARVRRFLDGPAGRRAVWLLLLAMVGLFALSSSRGWLPAPFTGPIADMADPLSIILKELLQVSVVLIATFVIAFIRHESMALYGLPGQKMFGKDFWVGALWGFVMLSAIVGLMTATRSYATGAIAISGLQAVRFGLLWAVAFLIVGLAEELAFRGYLQYALTMRFGFWPASLITCFFFGFAHRNNPGENWVGMANIVLIGAFACMALRRTGSLWFPIGWHMAFDWGESFFYSVPDSGQVVAGHLFNAWVGGNRWLTGGTVGPEASVFNVIVTLAGIVLLARFYPDARYPQPLRKNL